MKTLLIFYDADCGICSRFRQWLEREKAFVRLCFLPYNSARAAELCPGLRERGADRELVVMADDGRIWQGAEAWVTCLWALRRWRRWARRLAGPALLPLAEKLCKLVSQNRFSLSRLLAAKSDRDLARKIEADQLGGDCGSGRCALEKAKIRSRKGGAG